MRILFFHRSRRCCPFLSCCLRMLFLLAGLLSHTLLRTDFLLGFSFPIDSFLLFNLIQHECELGRVVGSPGKRKPCYTQRVSPCAESFGKHWPTDHFLLMGRMSQADGTRTYVGDQLLCCVLSMLLGKCRVLSRQRFLHHTVDHRIVYILSGCFHFSTVPEKTKKARNDRDTLSPSFRTSVLPSVLKYCELFYLSAGSCMLLRISSTRIGLLSLIITRTSPKSSDRIT